MSAPISALRWEDLQPHQLNSYEIEQKALHLVLDYTRAQRQQKAEDAKKEPTRKKPDNTRSFLPNLHSFWEHSDVFIYDGFAGSQSIHGADEFFIKNKTIFFPEIYIGASGHAKVFVPPFRFYEPLTGRGRSPSRIQIDFYKMAMFAHVKTHLRANVRGNYFIRPESHKACVAQARHLARAILMPITFASTPEIFEEDASEKLAAKFNVPLVVADERIEDLTGTLPPLRLSLRTQTYDRG